MRGTDVSQPDLDAARRFIEAVQDEWPTADHDHESICVRRGDLIRLLAWYGALRVGGDGSGIFRTNAQPAGTPGQQTTEKTS